MNRLWCRILVASSVSFAAGLIGVFRFGPEIVASRFNPIVGTSQARPSESVQQFHQSLTVVDLHADSLLWGRDLRSAAEYGHVDIPRLIEGNVTLQTFTVVTQTPSPLRLNNNDRDSDDIIKLALLQRWPVQALYSLHARAMYQAGRLRTLADSDERFELLENRQDLETYLQSRQQNPGLTAGVLGLEGAHALEGDLDNLNELYETGYRVIGLTHFFDNEVSGSAHGIERGGLTEFGREVVMRMGELGMIVDLAHASESTIDDVLAMGDRPVMVSHTGVRGTCDNGRNLSDLQIEQIAKNGGVIGIGFWSTAVCGTDVESIVRAIRYVVDLVGVEHVALGSDFDGAVGVPFDVSDMDLLTEALLVDGFSEAEIRRIMGDNAIALFQQNLPIQ